MSAKRRKLRPEVKMAVLTEAGFRCGVPTCRTILAIDLHHMVRVSEGGPDEQTNLLALCPTCHALFHRGVISREAIYSWKGILVALNQAFDKHAVDDLLFLEKLRPGELAVSGDGVLRFSRLIAADLAAFRLLMQNGPLVLYEVGVTEKGKLLVDAWKEGDRESVSNALASGVESA
ncbi:MAG: HNH endonuclease [Deltaproteobacteria bacterium]|nr:HNH endonuclease [Deltaproteobacteria bacterium]